MQGVAVGKVELMPLGAFTKDGTYFEGDVERETSYYSLVLFNKIIKPKELKGLG
jgi:hypothetical protein